LTPRAFDVIAKRATAPIDGNASPRKPIVWMLRRSTSPPAPQPASMSRGAQLPRQLIARNAAAIVLDRDQP
jgi:hypothetical protein